ncbi:hypothetical protein PSSHI_22830 [Photobacterium sp. R1]
MRVKSTLVLTQNQPYYTLGAIDPNGEVKPLKMKWPKAGISDTFPLTQTN